MTDWQPIESAPRDTLILLGTESDPAVDKHMFFIDLGWSHKDGFWSVADNDIIFPSHWAPISSPVAGAAVTFHRRGQYVVNANDAPRAQAFSAGGTITPVIHTMVRSSED